MSPIRWTTDRMDQLERAARDGLRVALSRRGTEYIVVAIRVGSVGRHEPQVRIVVIGLVVDDDPHESDLLAVG